MNIIKTTDVWIEQHRNHFALANGCFSDGISSNKTFFDKYKIVKNCNCIITSTDPNLPIGNKHNAIVFYNKNKVVRLALFFKDTNLDLCIENALKQTCGGGKIEDVLKENNVLCETVDLGENPIFNHHNLSDAIEVDVGSCDRMSLLEQMLKGSYTEDESKDGNYDDINYVYDSNLEVDIKLKTDTENFQISHKGSFINATKTRIIILQKNSEINFKEINGDIVRAGAEDMNGCARILREIYNNNVLSEGWTEESSLNICKFYYKMQPDLFFVAKKDGKVIGFSFSYIKPWADGNHLMVEEISVDPNYRKGGTAIKLISKVFETAIKKYGVVKVEGTTYEDENGAPFKIYKKLGFTKIQDLFLIECEANKFKTWF